MPLMLAVVVQAVLLAVCSAAHFANYSAVFAIPGLEVMASDKYPHFTTIETVSRTKFHRHRREVIAGPIYDWNSFEIPYQIWGGDYNFQNLIRRGIRMWEESTCLRFRENMASRDAIRYVLEKGDSCFTEYIGRNGGHQDIIIGSECAEEYVVAHETGHALGFWHTHQRPDRDRHISINWKNVMEEATASFMPFRSMLQAFGIRQVSPRRVPYDYGSLMHYHAVAHAIKVSDFTIVPKELKYVTTMGTEKMAFLDAKVINDIYCPNACTGRSRLNCLAGGYPDPNNCNVCRCPEGLGGADCSRLQPSFCGGEIRATDQWQTLSSPTGKDVHCYWRISVPEGSRVRFRLSDGEFPCSYGCQSYVEIKHKLDVRLTGFRRSCEPKMFIASALNFLVDLGLLGLLVCITRPTDNSHPLAALVTVSTAPYWARLYPIVVQTATYNTDPFYARPTNTTLRFIITNAIDTRDQAYESMMLYTVVFTWIMGGAYTIEGLLRSIREDRELTVCQTRRRALIPMTLGLLLAMMIYNNMFEPLVPEFYDDIPHTHRGGHVLQLGLSSAILTLIIAVVFAYCRLRKMPTPATPVQEAAFRHIRSLIVFFALSSFPLIYIMYQMSAWLRAPPNGGHFQFANYVCYIRLIYMFAFAFLEPYSTRLRGRCLLRDSCGSPPVAPSPANFSGPGGAASFPPLPRTASEPAGPLPDKGTYEAPPSYEAFPSTYELPRNVVVGTPMPMPPAFEDVVLADAAKRGVTPIA